VVPGMMAAAEPGADPAANGPAGAMLGALQSLQARVQRLEKQLVTAQSATLETQLAQAKTAQHSMVQLQHGMLASQRQLARRAQAVQQGWGVVTRSTVEPTLREQRRPALR
jgi:hypothetical protein